MSVLFKITPETLRFQEVCRFAYHREGFAGVEVDEKCLERVVAAQKHLYRLIEKRLPIYGVTTGFGDSCSRFVDPSHGEILQANLISYLLCASGPLLPVEACRAMFLIRLKSLSRGYSGVSPELIERMSLHLSHDWIPAVPREGSLGASGDLIPLAYLAQSLQGRGQIHVKGRLVPTADLLAENGLAPYVLKAKEGLALVNGTSAMAGMCVSNLVMAKSLLDLSCLNSAWLCLALHGRTEPFDVLVNEGASAHLGQRQMAKQILGLLRDEDYDRLNQGLESVAIENSLTSEPVQDRYSLRCSPQILGPVSETLRCLEDWFEAEINSTSDNPLIGEDGRLGMGGNFYGGYLSQGMDYLKISLAHLADQLDRQLTILIDDKSNRGLPANLADWPGLPQDQHHLHHGLKGLHQSASAITSEIMAKAIPNGIFSRSSESHNQDKVSLGMSAAVQCEQMLDQVVTLFSLYLICLAQALDLKKIRLKGERSVRVYSALRAAVPFVTHDQPMDHAIAKVRTMLRERASNQIGERPL